MLNLKLYRQLNKLTQQEVADQIGTSQAYYGMVENGVEQPSKSKLELLVEIFGLEAEYLFSQIKVVS